MIHTTAPTATKLAHQRKAQNLMEVPNLLNTPECLHPLYVKIRKCSSIECFSQNMAGDGRSVSLRLCIRHGEIINYVVRSKVKALFKGFEHTFMIYGRDALVNIKLPL